MKKILVIDDDRDICLLLNRFLSRRGYEVVGFDIAPTAIAVCQKRFPGSTASYVVADLFDSPSEWRRAFDFVLESYTLQVLPAPERQRAIVRIADFVAPDGLLLVIARGRAVAAARRAP